MAVSSPIPALPPVIIARFDINVLVFDVFSIKIRRIEDHWEFRAVFNDVRARINSPGEILYVC